MSKSAPSNKPLSDRERRFVAAFIGQAAGNATKAAELAGYSKKSASRIGYRLSRKVQIQTAIGQKADKAERSAIADATERDEILTAILRNAKANENARIKAAAELNKCSGRHIAKLEHSGPNGVPIQVITGVPQPEQGGRA